MNVQKEKELIKHRCCFIGAPLADDKVSKDVVISKLRIALHEAINRNFTTFITGMTPGPDIWAASLVFETKNINSKIKIIAAVPYPKYGKTRDYKYNLEYKHIIERADFVKFINNFNYIGVLKKRDIWMIDHSSLIIAVIYKDNKNAEIQEILEYAKKEKKKIRYIEI